MKTSLIAGLVMIWAVVGAGAVFVLTDDVEVEDACASIRAPVENDGSANRQSVDRVVLEGDGALKNAGEGVGDVFSVRPDHSVKPSQPDKPTVASETVHVDPKESARIEQGKTYKNIHIDKSGTAELDSGSVKITGDMSTNEKVTANKTTLQFDGTGTITGSIAASRMEFLSGVRRFTKGANLTSTRRGNTKPGDEGFYIARGATVIIEQGARWTTSAAYGFRIDGTLIVDGGTFSCTFSNGNGKATNRCWGEGSRLEVRSGSYHATGDADFKGADIVVSGGVLQVDDDIWNTGSSLTQSGGMIVNQRWGGQFTLTGNVNLSGGEMRVYSRGERGLCIPATSNVSASGGTVKLYGGQIRFQSTSSLYLVEVHKNVTVSGKSSRQATLYVNGGMKFAKGRAFNTNGFDVLVAGETAVKGVFIQHEENLVAPPSRAEKELALLEEALGEMRKPVKKPSVRKDYANIEDMRAENGDDPNSAAAESGKNGTNNQAPATSSKRRTLPSGSRTVRPGR